MPRPLLAPRETDSARPAAPPLSVVARMRRASDRFLTRLLLAHWLLALGLAPQHGTWRLAILVGALASGVPFLLAWRRPGALVTRLAVAAALMTYSALFIQQTHGASEAHFHVFVALAFLVPYRDWRVPVFGAALIAVHHVVFFALQHAGVPVWLMSHEGGVGVLAVHIAFVVGEVAVLAYQCLELHRAARHTQIAFAAAERLAAGDLSDDAWEADSARARRGSDLAHDNLVRSFTRIRATLRAMVDEANAVATAVRTGHRDVGQHAAQGVAGRDLAVVTGEFRKVLVELDGAADGAITLRRQLETEAAAAAHFVDAVAHVAARVRARDLTPRLGARHPAPYDAIAAALDAALGELAGALSEVQRSAEQITAAAGEIALGSQALASDTAEQAGALDAVTARVIVVAQGSTANAHAATAARAGAATARASANAGVAAMGRLDIAMRELTASTGETARVVRTIDEAARAGDAGRGFAVVAEEVRALAQRSAAAAHETGALLAAAQAKTVGGAGLARDVAAHLDAVHAQVRTVDEALVAIAGASDAQDAALAEVRATATRLTALVQQAAANAEESASAAHGLSDQAGGQLSLVERFTLVADSPSRNALAASVEARPRRGMLALAG